MVGIKVVDGCDDIVDVAVSTFPSLAVRMSNRASWVMSGKSERSRASFRSVDSSSTEVWTGSNRRRFLETKASMAGVPYVLFVVFEVEMQSRPRELISLIRSYPSYLHVIARKVANQMSRIYSI